MESRVNPLLAAIRMQSGCSSLGEETLGRMQKLLGGILTHPLYHLGGAGRC